MKYRVEKLKTVVINNYILFRSIVMPSRISKSADLQNHDRTQSCGDKKKNYEKFLILILKRYRVVFFQIGYKISHRFGENRIQNRHHK